MAHESKHVLLLHILISIHIFLLVEPMFRPNTFTLIPHWDQNEAIVVLDDMD